MKGLQEQVNAIVQADPDVGHTVSFFGGQSGSGNTGTIFVPLKPFGERKATSDEIIARSETATRVAIRKLKPGTYHGESQFDVPGGELIALKTAVTIDAEAGSILVDFAGSSMQTATGINVVLNYTHAYSTFAIRSCLNPELPNNTGSLAPIQISAPKGSISQIREMLSDFEEVICW